MLMHAFLNLSQRSNLIIRTGAMHTVAVDTTGLENKF